MAFDYAKAVGVANRLIGENGRAISLRRPPSAPLDPAKPWGARATTGTVAVTTTGVFFDLEKEDADVGLASGLPPAGVERLRQRVLVPPAPELPEEVGPAWQIDDGDLRWEILVARPVRPGGTLVYYELLVQL